MSAALASARSGRIAVVALLLFAASIGIFSINLGRLPFPDELYHVLAARGLLETGEPRIAEGLYERGLVQTWLTAWSLRLFGDNLAAARIPSVVAMAGLVALLFVWLRSKAGTSVALLTAVFYGLSPFAIAIAHFCRFYALQTLAFFLGSALLFEAIASGRTARGRIALAGAGVAALAFAVHLQIVSAIGIVGLGLYFAGVLLLPRLWDRDLPATRRLALGLGLLAAVLLGAGLAAATGLLGELWARFRHTETFGAHLADQVWYYHAWYQLLFPSLWPATGLLALLALARWPRPVALALVVFATAFLLHSLAGSKNLRYIAYAQPFLVILWSLGLAALWSDLRGFLAGLVDRLPPALAVPEQSRRPLARLLVAGAVGFLVLANPAWLRSVTLLADVPIAPERAPVDWPAARPALAPHLDRAAVVVTSEELGTLYFLGRFDLTLNASRYDELVHRPAPTIVRDPRTGRGVGRDLEAMRLVLACRAPGLFISLEQFWNDAPQIIDPTVKALLQDAQVRPIGLPGHSGLVAFAWDDPIGSSLDCGALEPAVPPDAR